MTEHTLEHAIAQVSKYKRLVKKARGFRKIVFKAHLAFWKEIRNSNQMKCTIWDDMDVADIDTAMIEYLFQHRENLSTGKDNNGKQTNSSIREIIVLDHKRSNAINIGMTKLPPPRIIKSAVMKLDSTIMNREGVEKLLTMFPFINDHVIKG